MILGLDHVNVRTAQLEAMVAWYGRVLEMRPGPRPDFGFPGTWLYAGDAALLHLVGVAEPPRADAADLRLEHAAFRASGMQAFVARLQALKERHEIVAVPGFPIVQVNVWDPDGNHLHVDFPSSEAGRPGP